MSVGEKLRRLRQMGLPEMRFRAAQRLRIQQEKFSLFRNGQPRADWCARWDHKRVGNAVLAAAISSRDSEKAQALLPGYFQSRARPRFFFSAGELVEIVAEYRSNRPERMTALPAEANALCEHRFRIFAYPEVHAGREIPWRRDLLHGKETPLEHWSRIPYLDFERAGDSKIVWEPNRHQHFFTLGQAYVLTGEERYAEECLLQLEHWQRENPPRRGINWASSLEAAFRTWSWLWMMHLLAGSRTLSGARLGALTALLAEHADYIQENLSVYFSPNTHLLGEGFSLYSIGLLLPELRGADNWRAIGRRILEEEMQKQVRPDGSHLEQSSYYHRYAADFFLCAAILADRNGCPFPTAFRQRLERMCEFILHTQLPGGLHPMTGDADGGRLLAFTPNNSPEGPNDQRGTLSTAAAYFRRGDFLHAAGGLREEAMWLDARSWQHAKEELSARVPEVTSQVFAGAGIVVQRSGWGANEKLLLFDAGPQGMLSCAHGHADSLQVICSTDGVDWLVDPGTYVYTSSRTWRDYFRSTRAHNTLVVDGLDQAVPVDFFKWKEIPQAKLEYCVSTPNLDVAIASHNGYERLQQPVTHRRTVVFVKPHYWIMSDSVEGAGEHGLEFNFHFAPGIHLESKEDGWRAAQGKAVLVLQLLGNLRSRVVEGKESPVQGWYSRDYGHRQAAPVLVCSTHAALPTRFSWMLWANPVGAPAFRKLPGRGIRLQMESELWNDVLLVRAQDTSQSKDELWTDADVVHFSRSADCRPARLIVANGCCFEMAGQEILCAESMLDELEVIWNREEIEVRAKPARRITLFAPDVARTTLNGKPAAFERCGDWIVLQGEA